MTDAEFLALKTRYYNEGYRGDLAVVAPPLHGKHPGTTNNREQNALRWGYDAAVKDLQERLNRLITGPFTEGS